MLEYSFLMFFINSVQYILGSWCLYGYCRISLSSTKFYCEFVFFFLRDDFEINFEKMNISMILRLPICAYVFSLGLLQYLSIIGYKFSPQKSWELKLLQECLKCFVFPIGVSSLIWLYTIISKSSEKGSMKGTFFKMLAV